MQAKQAVPLPPQISGEYAVQVTNGCTEISDCFIITNTLGFDELGNGFNVDLFPNPTLGSVTFNIQGVKQLDMELYDLQGKLLMHQNGIWDQDQISLEALVPVLNWQAGFFILIFLFVKHKAAKRIWESRNTYCKAITIN